MTFERPIFFALLLLLPLVWLQMRKSPGASRACLALKCLVFIVLVIALADPWAADSDAEAGRHGGDGHLREHAARVDRARPSHSCATW